MWPAHTSPTGRRAGAAPFLAVLSSALLVVGCSGSEGARRFPSSPTTDTASPPPTSTAGSDPATDPTGVVPPVDTTVPVDPAALLAAATLTAADLPPGFEARGEPTPAVAGPPPTNAGSACGTFLLANRRLDEVPNLSSPELVATTPDGRVAAKIESAASVLPDDAEAEATMATLADKDTCVRRALTSSLTRSTPDAEVELVPSVPLEVGDGGIRYSGRLTQGGASAQLFVDFVRVGPVVVQVSAVDGAGRLSSIAGIERALAGRLQATLAPG